MKMNIKIMIINIILIIIIMIFEIIIIEIKLDFKIIFEASLIIILKLR